MTDLVVRPQASPLVGGVPVPADKQIGLRALVLAALSEGASEIRGLSMLDDDVARIVGALRALGVKVDELERGKLRIGGVGLFGLMAPAAPLDCGGAPTTTNLLAGILVGQTFRSELARTAGTAATIEALRERGAAIEAPEPERVAIGPLPEGKELGDLELEAAASSSDLKSAVLLSGLFAHGATWFKEPSVSRDHTERALHALGVPIRAAGTMLELDPAGWSGKMPGLDLDVPGDFSAAAFVLAAALTVPGSRVTVRGVGTNPTRTGFVAIARHMGATIEIVDKGERHGEPVAEATAGYVATTGALVGGEVAARAASELPIVCALAARSSGTTRIGDVPGAALGPVAGVLRVFGVACEVREDGIVVRGGGRALSPAEIDSGGDPTLAMTAVVLALSASGPSRIREADGIASIFPRFVGTLRALGAHIDVERS